MKITFADFPIGDNSPQKGFTLIELLVVLMLIGLVMALAVPNIKGVYDNFRRDQAREEIEAQLKGLSFKAYLSGKPVTLEDIQLPAGFSFADTSSLIIRADGYCKGSNVTVESEDERFVYHLNPPLCKPELLESENEI